MIDDEKCDVCSRFTADEERMAFATLLLVSK